ncbi:MAG: hypothetical protein ACTSXW_06475 [Candidatus Baldrarchaeia archaeon]
MSKEDPLIKELEKEGVLSEDLLEKFVLKYGELFWRAINAVEEKRVKKFVFKPSEKCLWIVAGRKRTYLVIPDFYCSCDDFYFNVVTRKKRQICYHILARKIAEALKLYEIIHLDDELYKNILNEIKLYKTNRRKSPYI